MTPTPASITDADLLRLRMHALGLAAGTDLGSASAAHTNKSGADRAAAVVNHMFAMQGQDWRSSKWAVGARAPGIRASDVVAAINAGLIVRSWPMRGTVHLVSAADIGWMQQLTNPKVLAGAPKRRQTLGMSDAALDRITEVSLGALAGGKSLTRDELSRVWSDAGIEWQPNWRYHLIWWLCQNGFATFGPVTESRPGTHPEPRLVLASEWIRSPRTLEGDAALAEFALRYVRGRGAATQKDLAAWAQLPAAAAKRGLELAGERGALVQLRRDDVAGAAGALWADPRALDTLTPGGTAHSEQDTDQWLLLPAFDEHILGYTIRDPQFDVAHLPHLVPGKNGMFLATVVHGGRAVGTWRRDPKRGDVAVREFPGERIDLALLGEQITRWAEFEEIHTPSIALA